jgi:hypothetical protein
VAVKVEVLPLHIAVVPVIDAVGVGYMVIVKVSGVPVQPLAIGVTVIVAEIGEDVAFVSVNEGIAPAPLAVRPIAILLLVQPKVLPETGPEIAVAEVVTPLQ